MIRILNEDNNLENAKDIENIKHITEEYLMYQLIDTFEDNLAIKLASKIKDYNPDWSPSDAWEVDDSKLDEARDNYVYELMQALFYHTN